MTRRRLLVAVVRAFSVIAIVVFIIPFLGVFDGCEGDGEVSERLVIDISDLDVGVPRFFEFERQHPLVVLRALPAQRRDLELLTAHVWGGAVDDAGHGVFVHWALSTGKFGGCRLEHKPALAAAATPPQAGWRGGYWAPGCEASYDYAGRAIKSREHAYGEYVEKTRRLRAPDIEQLADGRLAIKVVRR